MEQINAAQPDQIYVAVVFESGHVIVLGVVHREYSPSGELRIEYDLTEPYIQSIIDRYTNWPVQFGPIKEWHVTTAEEVDRINADRTYRNAWTFDGKSFDHDMEKAKEIQRVYLRKARLADFCRLDNDYRIADEAGDTAAKTAIGAVRQKFRDVPTHPRIDAAKTVQELKTLKLSVLVPEAQGERSTDLMRANPARLAEVKASKTATADPKSKAAK